MVFTKMPEEGDDGTWGGGGFVNCYPPPPLINKGAMRSRNAYSSRTNMYVFINCGILSLINISTLVLKMRVSLPS